MEWTESTPLSVENLNDLEQRIDTANQNVTDAKTPIASAITTMGQAASGADTFAQLATKITDISKDATATVGDVLAPETFYQGGVKKTGNIPRRPGATNAPSFITDGNGNLWVRLLDGYYPVGAEAKIFDPDFIAANFRADKNVLGLQGAMPVRATGTGTVWNGQGPNGNLWTNPPQGYWGGGGIDLDTGIPWNAGEGVAARAVGRNGNDIWLYPSQAGYVDTDSIIYITDNNWVENNIRDGVPMFGKVGTLVQGKRTASGTATMTRGAFNVPTGYSFAVNGLSFRAGKVFGYITNGLFKMPFVNDYAANNAQMTSYGSGGWTYQSYFITGAGGGSSFGSFTAFGIDSNSTTIFGVDPLTVQWFAEEI